jgi:hypothetical protein
MRSTAGSDAHDSQSTHSARLDHRRIDIHGEQEIVVPVIARRRVGTSQSQRRCSGRLIPPFP